MPAPGRLPTPRYRRRILIAGLIAAGALYSFGAPVYVGRIEDDLEQRVPEEMADAGFAGIVAEFSGQDGTLRCSEPLSDPEAATGAAYDVWGVRAITLDRSCRVNIAPSVEDGGSGDASSDASGSGDQSSAADGSATIAVTDDGIAFATIADLVDTEPRLSYLAVLLGESGFIAQLSDPDAEPVTLFAPTDDAFEQLPADVNAQLRSDPELLAQVLGHHVVTGRHRIEDLVSGPLTMIDDSSVTIDADLDPVTVDGVPVADPDLAAGNGIVHVIESVLVPDGIDTAPPATAAEVSATLAGGVLTIAGTVASEVDRAKLTDAASFGAGSADGVVDLLIVDPTTGLDAATADSLAKLVSAMPANLVSGVSGFDGRSLYSTGVYATDAGRDALTLVARSVGVAPDLRPQPAATAEQAAALETELNAYVAANPVTFQAGQAVLTPESAAVLDELAARLLELHGLTVVVEGHTDSDGDPARNLTLSRQRADAVRIALIARGITDATITSEGFGSEQPVMVDGVEDKAASRRVGFRVEATP
jgi:OOP family OmpA-OmpF porin